jgi:hypothetical protein
MTAWMWITVLEPATRIRKCRLTSGFFWKLIDIVGEKKLS